MTIQKPEPLVIGNKAFYTLTSYGPVDVEVHVVRTTDEEVELAIQTLVREAGGTEKDLADPAWVASHFDGLENEQRLREQTRAYLSSLSEDSAEEQKANACLDALAERLCQSVPAAQVSQVKDALFQDIAQQIATTGQPVEAVLAQMGMRPDQLDSMLQSEAVKEAEQFAAEDKKHKDEVDTHNAADQVIYQTEKTLNELGDKVSESEKAPVQAALEDLKTKNKGNDIEAIKAATDAVQKAFYAISEKLYQQAAPQQGEANNGGAANNGGHDDGVVDADYEEVKD